MPQGARRAQGQGCDSQVGESPDRSNLGSQFQRVMSILVEQAGQWGGSLCLCRDVGQLFHMRCLDQEAT